MVYQLTWYPTVGAFNLEQQRRADSRGSDRYSVGWRIQEIYFAPPTQSPESLFVLWAKLDPDL